MIYPLENILTIAIAAVLAGVEGWEEMEAFARAKRSVFEHMLDLSAGLPKHDVYRRVLCKINPAAFQSAFLAWTRALLGNRVLGHIAIDGKTIRGSQNTALDKSPLHMVSAWASEHKMVFAQRTTDKKSNEITAIPKLLALMPLKGSTITIDAMGCQHKIARQIINGEGYYLFCLKGNQTSLHDDIHRYVEDARKRDFRDMSHETHTSREKNRGRHETRTIRVITDVEWIQKRHKNWQHIESVLVMERIRKTAGDTSPHREVHYYISNRKAGTHTWMQLIRDHWQIENTLHWTLDVTFGEDDCPINDANGAENLAILRHLALSIFKRDTTRNTSIRRKKKLAAWDDQALIDFLKQI